MNNNAFEAGAIVRIILLSVFVLFIMPILTFFLTMLFITLLSGIIPYVKDIQPIFWIVLYFLVSTVYECKLMRWNAGVLIRGLNNINLNLVYTSTKYRSSKPKLRRTIKTIIINVDPIYKRFMPAFVLRLFDYMAAFMILKFVFGGFYG